MKREVEHYYNNAWIISRLNGVVPEYVVEKRRNKSNKLQLKFPGDVPTDRNDFENSWLDSVAGYLKSHGFSPDQYEDIIGHELDLSISADDREYPEKIMILDILKKAGVFAMNLHQVHSEFSEKIKEDSVEKIYHKFYFVDEYVLPEIKELSGLSLPRLTEAQGGEEGPFLASRKELRKKLFWNQNEEVLDKIKEKESRVVFLDDHNNHEVAA